MRLDSTISYNPDILTSDMGDEVVMLNILNSEYYGLDSVGCFIWQSIENSITISDLVDKLLLEFAIDRETCINEVSVFLQELHQQGLIQIDP